MHGPKSKLHWTGVDKTGGKRYDKNGRICVLRGRNSMICNLCPRMCAAERNSAEGFGVCGMGTTPYAARAALHFDEEPVISVPGMGSGAVFFSGCALKCVFCQNHSISHGRHGKLVTVERLREIYRELLDQGAANINLVSASHFAPMVAESLSPKLPVPVIWNSSGYERVETIRMLEGLVDVYLPDFKYASADCARRYSGAEDYFEYASRAIGEMLRQTGNVVLNEDGAIQRGTIIRHLILPGQVENTKKVLRYIKEHFDGAWVSLMAQYLPFGKVQGIDELERRLTQEEYDKVVDHLLDLGLEDGFVQELSSSDEKYIPAFDMTGV